MRIYILLFLLVLPSVVSAQPADRSSRPIAGIVNGDTVWLDDFSREVGRRSELSKQAESVTLSDVIEQSWQEIVRMILLRKESGRRGIEVTRQDVDSVLLQATPDFVKQGVVDDKGRFDARLLHAMATNPDSLVAARGKKLSASERTTQVAQLTGSMDELRGRIAYLTLVGRLKESVATTFTADTAKLTEQFTNIATSAVAEVMFFQCPAMEAIPTDAELEAYHKAHSDRYTTTEELRRLALLVWPMDAAPVDSVLVLQNIVAWVEALNSTSSKLHRDTVWNSISSTIASGATLLHPDSSTHKVFYGLCKGKKVGTAVGPIVHPSGAHVLLIDSVIPIKGRKDKIYGIRVAITDITPSKETIDSTLAEVQTAGEMYDRGTTLGDLAAKFDKKIEISPFFGKGDKIFDSYRLMSTAFETQVGAACPAVDVTATGVVIGVVIDSVPKGPLPIEASFEQVAHDMRVELSCKSIEKTVKSYAAIVVMLEGGTMFIPEAPKEAQILRDATVTMDGLIGESILDPFAAKAICSVMRPGLMDAFRGDAGWYVVNVKSVQRPAPEDFPLFLLANGNPMIAEQREAHWNAWATELRNAAEIVDYRWMYFRY